MQAATRRLSSTHFEIERRANLSYEEFAARYLFPKKPVILTDALVRWGALARWSPDFFRREFGSMRFSIGEGKNGTAGDRKSSGSEYSMAEFIDIVEASTEERPAPYFRNRILREEFPSLLADIEPLPPYFFPNWLPESFLVKSVERVFHRGSEIELYIGGKGGAFPILHYDGLASHAFLMQIYGQKKFILFGPDQEQYLYGTPGQPHLSQIGDIDHPDLARFPLFAAAEPTTFILEPGEMLFIPSKWWHTTKMLSPSISVSVNVVNGSNWGALTEFVASKRRPAARVPSRLYLNYEGAWRTRRDRKLLRLSTPVA